MSESPDSAAGGVCWFQLCSRQAVLVSDGARALQDVWASLIAQSDLNQVRSSPDAGSSCQPFT